MKIIIRFIAVLTALFTVAFIPENINKQEFPQFRVVIDPGHGGISMHPMDMHGDRYDSISKQYLDNFRDGAAIYNLKEHEIVYSIAAKVEKLIKLCAEDGDYYKFAEILKKYTDEQPQRIIISYMMSRGPSVKEKDAEKMEDPNSEYRIFDYPDKQGKIKLGRLSIINSFKPQLVVSLHLAGFASADFTAMNPVLLPPYSFLQNGLLLLKKKISNRFYFGSPYDDWFEESNKRSSFEWFLNDVSLYYNSYPLNKNLKTEKGNFKGYRYNMISWKYRDSEGWEKFAQTHPTFTKYSESYEDITPTGKFWDREKSIYEDYRRSGGYEGFGGDNAYASYELVRYMLYAMNLKGYNSRSHIPGKPYISIWIVPHHINAVSSFIELGYLNRAQDRYMLLNKQNELAEGIAVGIYSMLTGLKLKNDKFKHKPKGLKIDFEKYKMSENKTYFEDVVE
jgi:hypothetical protein